ncbi:hypothetical protein OQA88_4479 [Cercophora sp. LCS_1]
MTKLPSESFWPTGAMASDSSVISPLTLPRGMAGYPDQVALKSQVSSASQMPSRTARSHVYSPLSPGARGPALPQFLSPHLVPAGRDGSQLRSASLPPTHRDTNAGRNRPRTNTATTPRTVPGLDVMQPAPSALVSGAPSGAGTSSISPSRTISADASSTPSHAQMIRRLVQQNGRIREAWEAERKYMEANRERAEEVYKEERALMEEERVEWEAEKAVLLREIERLQQRVISMGGTLGRSRDGSGASNKTVYAQSHALRGGGPWEASPESMRSSMSSQGSGQRATAVRYATSLPQMQPEGLTGRALLGLDPLPFRTGTAELAAVPEAEVGPVPIVDVQEIHPELEGIPIKANTIQKPTFTDTPSPNGSRSSSRTSSPPSGSNRPRVASQGSKEQTLQVLAAEESARLTMHAGHTPSHSLSLLPTVSSSATHTVVSSGESTPTMLQADGVSSQGLPTIGEEAADILDPLSDYHNEPEPQFETEDRPLKGPLMVRNMPAHDEIFFRRLSDKLEEVVRDDQTALPAVLKDLDEGETTTKAEESDLQPEAKQLEGQQDGAVSAGSDSGTEKSRGSPKSGDELDIPLKLKGGMNFGAPFGTFR